MTKALLEIFFPIEKNGLDYNTAQSSSHLTELHTLQLILSSWSPKMELS